MHAGNKEIFNLNAATSDSPFIFVVEGEIDCMSIWQATKVNFPLLLLVARLVKIGFLFLI